MKTLKYDGIYYYNFQIDKKGNIKNLKTNHIYKHSINKKGYLIVTLPLGNRGKVKSIRVHKAVAETFIPNPFNKPIVHHKDENKLNPNVNNLEWVSSKINTSYHLEKESQKTDFYNNRKLTNQDIIYIRKNASNFSRKELSQMFNVSKTTITNVINYIYYKNIV